SRVAGVSAGFFRGAQPGVPVAVTMSRHRRRRRLPAHSRFGAPVPPWSRDRAYPEGGLFMRILKLALVASVAAFAALPATAQTYKEEYKISTVVPAPFPWGIAAERWAELVGERTDGRIKMKVYPGAQLVSGDQDRKSVV